MTAPTTLMQVTMDLIAFIVKFVVSTSCALVNYTCAMQMRVILYARGGGEELLTKHPQ